MTARWDIYDDKGTPSGWVRQRGQDGRYEVFDARGRQQGWIEADRYGVLHVYRSDGPAGHRVGWIERRGSELVFYGAHQRRAQASERSGTFALYDADRRYAGHAQLNQDIAGDLITRGMASAASGAGSLLGTVLNALITGAVAPRRDRVPHDADEPVS